MGRVELGISSLEKKERKGQLGFITDADPESFLTDEERKWAREKTVVTISPITLALDPALRFYGGTENVVWYNMLAHDEYGLNQVNLGNPLNRYLDSISPRIEIHYPSQIDESKDLLKLLRTDKPKFDEIDAQYHEYAFEWIMKNKDRINVVHDHTSWREWDSLLIEAGIPVVRTEHGPLRRPYISEDEDARMREFGKKDGVAIVSISDNQRRDDWEFIDTVYNGIHLADFKFQEKKSNYLLILGRVSFHKGIRNAIEIAKKAGMRLVIAGEDEGLGGYFETQVAPAIHNKREHNIIHYSQGVDPRMRQYLMSNAFALLAPNEWEEPFGMMMAEALASGTPVIGFNRGSIPEVVGKDLGTGFVVDNVDEAVDAVQKRHGEFDPWACRRRAEWMFSAQSMAAHYIRVYMETERRFNERFGRAA